MKLLLLALLAYTQGEAQTTSIPVEPSLRQQLHHIFAPLDKSQTATSLFFDQALPLVVPSRYRGAIADSNTVDINTFGMLYGNMLSIPPKNPFFTFKTQHRRWWPQPSP